MSDNENSSIIYYLVANSKFSFYFQTEINLVRGRNRSIQVLHSHRILLICLELTNFCCCDL